MEQPRAPTEEERLLARNCAFVAQDLADFLVTVAERNAKVTDLLMKRLWDFMAFPPAVDFMLEGLRRKPSPVLDQ